MLISTNNMKEDIIYNIALPQGVEAEIKGNEITVKGKLGELKRKFDAAVMSAEKKEGNIVLKSPKASKNEKRMINSIRSHVENMVEGVQKKYRYELKICHVHFPITATYDKGKNIIAIKNFLGEKKERIANIVAGVDVKVDKDTIVIESPSKEDAGQTATNIEKASKIRNRDRRIYQDGIFMVMKCGKEI